MRLRLTFGAVLIPCAGVVAAACSGFSSEETQTTPSDSGVTDDSVFPQDTGAALDATEPDRRFGSPKVIQQSSALITARYTPTKSALFLGVTLVYVKSNIQIARDNAAPEPLLEATADGGIEFTGSAPSITSSGILYHAGPGVDGGQSLLARGFTDAGRVSAALPFATSTALFEPYVLPSSTVAYFHDGAAIVRTTLSGSILNVTPPTKVTFKLRDDKVGFATVRAPVVTADESKIYFAVPDPVNGEHHVWVATRVGDPALATFHDAHRLDIEGSTGSEVPTWVSLDGNELVFSRSPGVPGPDGGMAALSVTR